jgi:hypothetical protein
MSNNLTAEQIGYVIGWLFIVMLLIYWAGVKIYEKGYQDGWAKGYVRGKVVQSERYID